MFAKKNLVAVAALMAMAGVAQAQSSVKLYGYVEAAIGSFEDAHEENQSNRATKVESGKMMTSFIGISGSEDLGGGLKAEFALESFLNNDTGSVAPNLAGGFWGRGSFVALTGGFGKVALGQYDNPLFTAGYTYNPFGSSMGFSPTMRHYYSTSAALLFDTGFVNSVTYESPVMSGFSLVAQYAPKETSAAGTSNSWSVAGNYAAGPLAASVVYVDAGRSATGSTTLPSTSFTRTAYLGDQKVWNLGASYDFGVVKGFLQYTQVKTDSVLALDTDVTPVVGVVGTNLDAKFKIWQIGVSVPLTDKASVLVSFGQQKYKETSNSDDEKDEVFSVGYDYALSKRTGVYGVFTNHRQTDLKSGQTFAVGIKHSF